VTGGAGFVGSAVVHALLGRADEVTVLDSGVAAGLTHLDGLSVHIVAGDIRDTAKIAEALAGADAVVHLAARTSVPDSIEDPLEDMAVNVVGTVELLDAARRQGVGRFVFASSNAVTSGHPPPAREDLLPRPVAPYGAAKAAVESYLAAYHDAFGMETVSLRFANAYGPRSRHKTSVVSAFIEAYLDGRPLVIYGDGLQTRDFVHVDDLAALVVRCLDAPPAQVAGEIFQAGTGREASLNVLAELIFRLGGAPAPIEHRPARAGDVARNYSDVSKAGRVLDHHPRVDLTEGMADTLDWFREDRRRGNTGR
jgi:UDP-glucose 4-epimerase